MPTHGTFGFEIEFQENAEAVVRHIHDIDVSIMPMSEMHRYHCDCGHCRVTGAIEDDYVFPLRAQTDSSCSGEIITKPFETMDEARPIMRMLEEAATETDAVPGMNAGFHVHVMMPRLGRVANTERFFQYIRWEPVLAEIALGRWAVMRQMNRTVRNSIVYSLESLAVNDIRFNGGIRDAERYGLDRLEGMSVSERASWLGDMFVAHREADRHSYLNLSSRHGTWEFRLFNSTRSAWRMELFCSLAAAFSNEQFVQFLATHDRDVDPDIIGEALIAAEFHTAAALLEKQIDYKNGINNGLLEYSDSLTVL